MTIRSLAQQKNEMAAPVPDWGEAARAAVAHAASRIAEAVLERDPMPYVYVTDVFPADFYAAMMAHFPTPADFKPMRNSYHGNAEISAQRHYLSYRDRDNQQLQATQKVFWEALFAALSEQAFADAVWKKFGPYADVIRRTLLGSHHDMLLINDRSGYDIGPHTDTPQKMFSLLFYCPATAEHAQLGTSLFRPKGARPRAAKRTDAWFRRGGDPALNFADFEKIRTMPYVPNALFGFVRTRYSYHGVEPTQVATPRQLLIYEQFSMRPSRALRHAR